MIIENESDIIVIVKIGSITTIAPNGSLKDVSGYKNQSGIVLAVLDSYDHLNIITTVILNREERFKGRFNLNWLKIYEG